MRTRRRNLSYFVHDDAPFSITIMKTFDLSRFAYKSGVSSNYTSKYAADGELARSATATTTSSSTSTPPLARSHTENDAAAPKSKKRKYTYEPPETFAELNGVPDFMTHDCDLMLVGINPGRTSATLGHHFAHPSNAFYSCLHESGAFGLLW